MSSAFDVLGDYRIIQQLGAGGMGCVYLATDENLHRKVALKVLKQDYVGNDEARERFFREARAAAALKHDNIVTIYQVGEDQGIVYLAMEHLEGKSLEDWLRPNRPASLSQAVSIGKQIARALGAAHRAGVIHRDIKPDNIWLEPNGRIKILDFGIAQHASAANTKLTQPGSVMGTPAYMSPEQALGQSVDHRTDLFSFGCVLYQMVTGRRPFQADTIWGVIEAIKSEQQPPARTLNLAVPESLSELIDRLLSKSREDRPSSAQAVLNELKALEALETQSLTGEDTLTQPPTQVPPITSETPSWKKWGGVALPIGLGLLGFAIWFSVRAAEDPAKADSPNQAEGTHSEDNRSGSTPSKDRQAIDLLADVNLKQAERGFWWEDEGSVYGRALNSKPPKVCALALPCPTPFPEEYCLKMQVERTTIEGGALLVTLTGQSTIFGVGFDGKLPNRKGIYYGIASARVAPPRAGVILNPNIPVDLAFWVSKDQLRITANEKEIYTWEGNFTQLRNEKLEDMPSPIMIGGEHPATFRFSNVRLIPNAKAPAD